MSTMITHDEKQETAVNKDGAEQAYQATYVPRFDIWEGEDELLLHGDLPGVTTDDLDVRFENRELSIRGKVAPRRDGEFLYDEYGIGDFHRVFQVGESIDAGKISAEIRGGVLTLHLPKSEKVKPRRIKVKAK